jgi:ubiquinone/menaquinone biosynthesis C-methylase UbiE
MRRITTAELLDDDLGTSEEIRLSLDDLWRINRCLGGISSNLRMLKRVLARTGAHSVRILEIGAGDSRLAGIIRQKLLKRGIRAEYFVLDRRLTHLANGRPAAAGLRPVVADGFALPFPERSFDVVTCNLFFHHFSGERAREFLRSLAGVASRAVLVSDLERHVLPYLFIKIAPLFARSRLTRHDAPASVRQAYTRDELAELAAGAGFRNFEVERILPFRLGLTLWK